MLLTVIIVSYEVKYFLEQCLFSVMAAVNQLESVAGPGQTEVLVIDNASQDDTIGYLRKRFPSIKFFANGENVGFAKANNACLTQAGGEFVLFLNPDTLLPSSVLSDCIAFFRSHPSAGAIGVRMIDGEGKFLVESKRGFPTAWRSFCKLSGLSHLLPYTKMFAGYNLGHLNEKAVVPIDALAGAYLMARREILQTIGGFDERFFMYAEDIDLSRRIRDAGFENYYLGNHTILHFKGESTKKDQRYVRMFYQAMSLYVQKYYTGFGSGLTVAIMKFGIALRSFIARVAVPGKEQGPHKHPRSVNFMGDQKDIGLIKERLEHIDIDAPGNLMVLCEGTALSFEQLIGSIQTLSSTNSLLVHASGSESVVGSFNKETRGLAISLTG